MTKNKYYILALVLVILAVVLFFVSNKDEKDKKVVHKEISPQKNNLDTISKDQKSGENFSTEQSYSFLIEPEYEEKVSFKISGKLESYSWKKGDKFKKGDLLFQLDNSALFEQIIESKKQLKIAIEENLMQIQDENFKQKWQEFLAQIKENDLLPEVPSFYARGYQEIQIINKVISNIEQIQTLEAQIFDYFYLAPFDGEFKGFNLGTDKMIKEKENFATIYPTKYAIIKGEINENSLEFYKKNGIIDPRESFVKSQNQGKGKVIIFKKIKKNKIPTYPFYNIYVIVH